MSKEKKIVASIIANSQKEFEERFEKVKNVVDVVQLDIMDGKFVESKSLMFNFILPKNNNKIEAHLMIEDPEDWINEIGDRVNTIIFHYESVKNPEKIITLIRKKGKKVGLAISPTTKVFEIKKYLEVIDQVLVFTANKMGSYGARFSEESLSKVNILSKIKELDIEVDGGINLNTLNLAYKKGANMFVCGSVLQKSLDIDETIEQLQKEII